MASGVASSASRRAATRNADSGSVRASDDDRPEARCPGTRRRCSPAGSGRATPPISTGGNGLPVATIARPPVQARMSAGRASVFAVGFESGRTIGRSALGRHRPDRGLAEGPGRARSCRAGRSAGTRRRPRAGRAARRGRGRAPRPRRAAAPPRACRRRAAARPSTSRPCESSIAIASRASSGARPASTIAIAEQPRDPGPRGAGAGQHDPRSPATGRTSAGPRGSPPTAIAAVPWMSSLKLHTQFR